MAVRRTDVDEKSIRISCGMMALAALKGWDIALSERWPYEMCAKVISGNIITDDEKASLDEKIKIFQSSAVLVNADPLGVYYAPVYALQALKQAIDDPGDEQAVYNWLSKVETSLKKL